MLCPAISHNSVLPRGKMAQCTTIFWHLSAPNDRENRMSNG